MRGHIEAAIDDTVGALTALRADSDRLDAVAAGGRLLADTFRSGGHVWACGNGGSLCDAAHFAEELSGRYRKNRPALGAVAMTDAAHLTCTANDLGYDQVFSRFVEGNARAGDTLLAISTSGTSTTVVRAAEAARAVGCRVLALTGRPASPLGALADVEVCTPVGPWADRVQENHIVVIHVLVELVERELFPELYED